MNRRERRLVRIIDEENRGEVDRSDRKKAEYPASL
jgi:hypothetical protein